MSRFIVALSNSFILFCQNRFPGPNLNIELNRENQMTRMGARN